MIGFVPLQVTGGVSIFLIAAGIFGLVWLIASTRTNEARKVYEPIASASLLARIAIALLSVWLLLSAGGIAAIFGLIAVALIALITFFERPDGAVRLPIPNFVRRIFRLRGRS